LTRHVLVTGGAGFIGSQLGSELLEHGYRVRALDDLTPQVHGTTGRPSYLADGIELVRGDIRDRATVDAALDGIDAVFHLAARVGVGQSMYEIADYTSGNDLGTAVLLEGLLQHRVERLVVASSMSIYGEGLYRNEQGDLVNAARRTKAQLAAREWEPKGSRGESLEPVPTPEDKAPDLSSIYALNKYTQERMCLMFGETYEVPTAALRFFNAYGPHQSLNNPYTGVLAIFASRLLNDRAPLIFEDGEQRRDFVAVSDVARACRLALENTDANDVFNIGSGVRSSVREIAGQLAGVLDKGDIEPEITGRYRVGDIRHCFADIERARKVLGFEPEVTLEKGMIELSHWLEGQIAEDRLDSATEELSRRGLTR
jgi:dTDP-L-rhamnose 4-epimerase